MSLLTADEMECLLTQGASATRAPPHLHSSVHFYFGALQLDGVQADFVAKHRGASFVWSLTVKILMFVLFFESAESEFGF